MPLDIHTRTVAFKMAPSPIVRKKLLKGPVDTWTNISPHAQLLRHVGMLLICISKAYGTTKFQK